MLKQKWSHQETNLDKLFSDWLTFLEVDNSKPSLGREAKIWLLLFSSPQLVLRLEGGSQAAQAENYLVNRNVAM